ncbi:MAG TPA: thioredoxin-dependent thiol peroxidase [Candidatus Paceibacterota bacterium]|nr:thioredoxin-dependent thiol peroxidase [Candidatus Paceibacterota bacterium]
MEKIQEKQKAPEFELPDQDGEMHQLSDYAGKFLVLYFYPKDDTPGCTKEACSFRDAMQDLYDVNVAVLGVSKDSVKSHKKFHEKYHLSFSILSDESTETIQAYESWGEKKFMGRNYMGTIRNTFLIDPEGNIAKIYENVKPEEHVAEILEDIKNLQK